MYRRNPAAHRQPAARLSDRKTARLSGLSIAVLLLTWAVVTPASAQQSEDGARSDGRQDVREGDREDREARRARWRQRWQQYRDATPEQRRQMRVDRWVERAARTYELDEAQKEQVRVEIEAIQRERREAMGADAEEYERLRQEMFEFRRNHASESEGDDEPGAVWRRLRNDPKFKKLRERMREIDRLYPFDWQMSVARIEALLPPEQAQRGRAKWEARREQWRARRLEREARRAREQAKKKLEELKKRDKASIDPEVQKLLADARKRIKEQDLDPQTRRELLKTVERAARDAAKAEQTGKPEPLHPWEKYVRAYIAKHDLTAAQQAAAFAILKGLRKRAAEIERAAARRLSAARQIADAKVRERRLAELRKPIDRLFEQLKARLDGLLTTAQRKRAASRPAPPPKAI